MIFLSDFDWGFMKRGREKQKRVKELKFYSMADICRQKKFAQVACGWWSWISIS